MKHRFVILIAVATTALAQNPPDPPMEQTKKNIKVLTGVPSSQLIPVMTVMANSLGVTCSYCHEEAFDSDAKPAKEAGRRMIRLVRSINDSHYGGQPTVTCNTCHRGRITTVDVPDLADAGYHRAGQSAGSQPPTVPAEDLFAAYRASWGKPEALDKLQNRRSRGVAMRRSGRGEPRSAPFELFQAKPNIAETQLELPYPPEANREFKGQFFTQLNLRNRYATVRTTGVQSIRGRAAYIVEAIPTDGGRPERLYFDVERGVLLRRERETPTIVGPLPESVDFDDYRTVDDVLVPFLLRWSRGDYEVTHTYSEVRHNVEKPE